MRCNRCGEKAVAHMRQHKLALCQKHFLEWIPAQVQRHIEKYRMFGKEDRILVAVSGGKDSLSLWDILQRLEYRADGLYIGLGINPLPGIPYSDESQRLAEKFASERGLHLQVVDVKKEYGETIPEMARRSRRGRGKPCAVCGLVKRHVMNRTALQGGYQALATGHNLDDEAAILFGNTLNWVPGYLNRQWPVLEANRPGLVRKTKPLCRIYERDSASYALLSGIEYIYQECPFSEGSNSIYYKELLNRLETDRPGAKLSFYLSFLEAKKNGLFAAHADRAIEKLHACTTCGQSTSAPGECAFCRMVHKPVE
jgi:uncharacterized protein (TIGR00269 family)